MATISLQRSFFYFAYGSNLLEKRIHIQNPSAIRKNIGKLRDHKLDFFGFSQRWGGASATIVPCPGHEVWGAIWEIDIDNMPNLDNQEGVAENIYFPKSVEVELPDGRIQVCRVYQRAIESTLLGDKPSILYKETILQGAIESQLPEDYLEKLRNISHNGYEGKAQIGHMLDII